MRLRKVLLALLSSLSKSSRVFSLMPTLIYYIYISSNLWLYYVVLYYIVLYHIILPYITSIDLFL